MITKQLVDKAIESMNSVMEELYLPYTDDIPQCVQDARCHMADARDALRKFALSDVTSVLERKRDELTSAKSGKACADAMKTALEALPESYERDKALYSQALEINRLKGRITCLKMQIEQLEEGRGE